ncbi:hypothetical protein D1970_14910 [Mesobacillus zeae]|uniref:Uncharacterized protein n=2 Tax=Mesobacillus zeae TaxID=1917180 RepID=A0A398B855_9BACI|nr:hypothetical protein D1970_14910 [Mesobacillus zeae]
MHQDGKELKEIHRLIKAKYEDFGTPTPTPEPK